MTRSIATRLALVFVLTAAAILAAATTWASAVRSAPDAIGHAPVILGLLVLLAAFWPLGRLADWHALAPTRVTVTIVVILSLLTALGLPAPHRAESVGSFVLLLATATLGLIAQLLAAPRPRWAFSALLVLATIGVYLGYAVDLYATSPRVGALVKESSLPVATLAMACIAACWYGRRLLRRTPVSVLRTAL